MKEFGNWLRNLGAKFTVGMTHFMAGRYGTDKLNMVILITGVVLSLVCLFIPGSSVKLIFTLISYMLMFWAIFRTFSRNTYRRYEENRKFLQFFDRLKDRNHKYFTCPKCHQSIRVPRHKGKIAITCPKCKERFVRKT